MGSGKEVVPLGWFGVGSIRWQGKGSEWEGLDMGMDMNGVALRGFADKARALAYRGEEDGGSEIVQVVIALGFAVGLGAALMILQTQVNTAITSAGNSVTNMFKSVTSGAVGSR